MRHIQACGEDMERALDAKLIDAVLDRLGPDRPAARHRRAPCRVPSVVRSHLVRQSPEARRPPRGSPTASRRPGSPSCSTTGFTTALGPRAGHRRNALHDLLAYLGFNVTRLTAAMLDLQDPNHATNLIDVDGARFLADTSVLSGEAIEVAGERTEVHSSGYQVDLTPDGDTWVMTFPSAMADRMVCRVFPGPSDVDTYRRLHEATRAFSPFNHQLHANPPPKRQRLESPSPHTDQALLREDRAVGAHRRRHPRLAGGRRVRRANRGGRAGERALISAQSRLCDRWFFKDKSPGTNSTVRARSWTGPLLSARESRERAALNPHRSGVRDGAESYMRRRLGENRSRRCGLPFGRAMLPA